MAERIAEVEEYDLHAHVSARLSTDTRVGCNTGPWESTCKFDDASCRSFDRPSTSPGVPNAAGKALNAAGKALGVEHFEQSREAVGMSVARSSGEEQSMLEAMSQIVHCSVNWLAIAARATGRSRVVRFVQMLAEAKIAHRAATGRHRGSRSKQSSQPHEPSVPASVPGPYGEPPMPSVTSICGF